MSLDGFARTQTWTEAASDADLESVRQAIGIERRMARKQVEIRVDHGTLADESEGIWHLEVAADAALPEGNAWIAARVVRELQDGSDGAPWSGEVLEVEPASHSLFVKIEAPDEPCTGPARVVPHDFLRAPYMLLTHARCAALMPTYRQLLRASLGGLPGSRLDQRRAPGPWNSPWGIVWGPPGTGKTYTLGRQVAELLSDPTERVLVVSTTNRATDSAAQEVGQGALDRGIDLAGIRRAGSIAEPGRFQGPLRVLLPGQDAELHQAIATQLQAAHRTQGAVAAGHRNRAAALRGRIPGIATLASDPELRAVITTLHGALGFAVSEATLRLLEIQRTPFTTVVVDEAGLVGRAQVAAVAMLASRRVVLVGDPRQLSPIARASRSMPGSVMQWIAQSGLEHLTAPSASQGIELLDRQRRMHPSIRAGIDALMYDGQLQDHASVQDRPWVQGGTLAKLPRLLWYPIDLDPQISPIEAASSAAPGRTRTRTGSLKVLRMLFERHPELVQTGGLFVSPYRGQASAVGAWFRSRSLERWSASTVHAQQGAEAQVVVFDTVHASSTAWQFSEWRRLVNVGLSRARQLCILIASQEEVGQVWMRPLVPHLQPRILDRVGGTLGWDEVAIAFKQENLFAPQLEAPAPEPLPPTQATTLGAQLARRRMLRPLLSAEQRQLVDRDLADAGPRLVRGVAGSGKTLVLAHWAVRALDGLGVASIVIVYANAALEPLLAKMLDEAWQRVPTRSRQFPWERVHLRHIRGLLRDLLQERGLPPPDEAEAWNYESQARRILDAGPLDPRFDCVLIDETQDLGHDPLEVILGLVRPLGDSLPAMIFYDNSQNVYGRKAPVWKDFGLDLRGRADVMRESFRSTRQITELALNVLHAVRPLTDDPDLRELIRPRTGPPLLVDDGGWWRADFCTSEGELPTIAVYDTPADELQALVEQVVTWVQRDQVLPGDIRILVPKRTVGEAICSALRHALGDTPVAFLTSQGFEQARNAVVVTTPQSYKGYDAEVVLVAAVDRFSSGDTLFASGLYVALTRARTVLRVTAARTGAIRLVAALEAGRPSEP